MSRHVIARYMSAAPVVINSARTLAEAHQVMREHHIRHLPVVDEGRLVGILSQRDLYLLETLRGVDATSETVAEAMTPDPYTTNPEAPLETVAREMAEHKYGAAVVMERGNVVGVFTTVDALRTLATMLSRGRGPQGTRPGVRPS